MMASCFGFSQEENLGTPSLIGKYVASHYYGDFRSMELKSDSTFEYFDSNGMLKDQTSYGIWWVEGNELYLDGYDRPKPTVEPSYECQCGETESNDSLNFLIIDEYHEPLFQVACVVNHEDSNLYYASSDFDGLLQIPMIDSATHIDIKGGPWLRIAIPMTDTCCSYTVTLTEIDQFHYFNREVWSFIPGKLYDPDDHPTAFWYDADKPYYLKEELVPFVRFFHNMNYWIRHSRF